MHPCPLGNAKHLQFVSGVNFVTYWLATAIVDFFMYLVPFSLTILCLVVSYSDYGVKTSKLALTEAMLGLIL